MTRLLLLSSEFPPGPGGIGTHAFELARHMTQRGWQVQVLTPQDYVSREEAEAFNRRQDFAITSLPRLRLYARTLWARWRQLLHLAEVWKPDVLVVSGDHQVWVTSMLKRLGRLNGLPVCAVWHGVIPPQRLARGITCWAFSQPDLTITVSQYSRGQMLGMGVRPRRELVITNGADEARFEPDPQAGRELRTRLGLPVEGPILLTVGHVTERKGQDIVIRALPGIVRAVPNVHYLIAGLPTLQASLEALAVQLGVREHVHFLGRVEAEMLPALYNACDVFVLVSRHSSNGEFEGYGIAAVEAALCERPSVVAENSGLAEAVQHERTGLLVPEDEPQATARAVLTLLQDPGLRQRMGTQARQRALAEQTWSASIQRYEDALLGLVHEGRNERA